MGHDSCSGFYVRNNYNSDDDNYDFMFVDWCDEVAVIGLDNIGYTQ
jgi:hypothetical protein